MNTNIYLNLDATGVHRPDNSNSKRPALKRQFGFKLTAIQVVLLV